MIGQETIGTVVRRVGDGLLLATLAAVLAGCAGATTVGQADASRSAAAISERSVPLREPKSPYRTVVPGDTLYSIAWESGRDYRELAAWNRIAAPYLIKPGQQLRVMPPVAADRKSAAGTPATSAAGPPRGQQRSATKPAKAPAARTAPTAKAAKPPATSTPKPATTAKAPAGTTGKRNAGGARAAALAWSWPADGQILNRYSESDTRGVDITAARGAPIRAAANGRVVYQGSGLRGYGQLIIIKHSDEFLSAYAHNDRIYVKEGEAVRRGQKIAEMGSTGTDRTKLHFEIRRHGVPVDPMKYLPRR